MNAITLTDRIAYYAKCAFLLARYRRWNERFDNRFGEPGFATTVRGIVAVRIRPHWLRG